MARRTHKMLRAANAVDNGVVPDSAFVGSCCKMFFPMDETSGLKVTDNIGALEITPTVIGFNQAGTVQLGQSIFTAFSSGSFPAIESSDFIFFTAQRTLTAGSIGTERPESTWKLYDASNNGVHLYDADGCAVYHNGNAYGAGSETLVGVTDVPPWEANYTGCAIVRSGNAIGNWVHAARYNQGGDVNDYAVNGDIFARGLRGEGYTETYESTFGRNDYDVPEQIYDPSIKYIDGIGNVAGGWPGVWVNLDPSFIMPAITQYTIGLGLHATAQIDYAGVVLYVFAGNVPSDFKEVLRAFRDSLLEGDKSLPIEWLTVE